MNNCAQDEEEGELTLEDKAAGLGSVFKRDDTRLASMREQDEREKVGSHPIGTNIDVDSPQKL